MTALVTKAMPARMSDAATTEHVLRAKIAHSSRQLVADALITPILEQFRASLKQEGVFGVTDAEKRLGPVIDQRVADSIVSRGRLPIVDRVELSMLKRVGLKPQPRATRRLP